METIIDFAALKFKHSENINATEKYFSDNEDLHRKIDRLVWAYHEIGHVIPQHIDKVFTGHNFAYTESQYEIECSYQLLKLSFYKYAFISLRNALELGLLSIYWDKDDNSEITIQDWHSSRQDTPFKRQVIAGLKTIDNINKFCRHYDLFAKIDKLYGNLSDFTHTKGHLYSGQNLNRANFTRFNENVIVNWAKYLEQVIQILLTVHILKYPVAIQHTPMQDKFGINGPMGTFLDIFQSEQIKEVLDSEELKILQEISDNDEGAKALASWVNSHPDISEDEFKKQIEGFDAFMKSHDIKTGEVNTDNPKNDDD
jgi:hypothetical protein